MKKFRFRLEYALKVRRLNEKERIREMAASLAKLSKNENKLEQYKEQERNSWAILEAIQKAGGRSGQLVVAYKTIEGCFEKRVKQEENVQHVKRETEVKRIQVVEAQRSRKLLEKFREKKYAEYVHKIEVDEQKDLDQIAAIRELKK